MTIYLENITKSCNGTIALKDFSLSVEEGRMYALVGPAGSGKTTALKIFMGDLKPDSGTVSRMGDYKYPTLQSAYVSQEGHLNPKKNAVWNVRKAHRTASKGRAIEELSRFLSEEEQKQPVGNLSEGKRRIVEIVRALFVPADFIVLDEPFAGMSAEEREKSFGYILEKRGTRPLLLASREELNEKGFRVIHMQEHP
ncbi:MAG: ATP-binding cassette domain-containing protein [Lachnospiraceae bacterium]|nr:ATP-binding cassette domain-containing protein [Lachnospiraceae bacterium]